MTLYGAVEMGGTKTDIAVGKSPGDMSAPHRVPTTTPDETLAAVTDFFSDHDVKAIGVASFGPLDLDPDSKRFGAMLATPKPHWSGAQIYRVLSEATQVPIRLETDVNGAAIGEGRWGAAVGMSDYVYMTVGTGIGAGIIAGGRTLRGAHHPEAGHIVVGRLPGDGYSGHCPYHSDCLEGMASGPALEARFGHPDTWAGNDSVVDLVSGYVAQGMRNLVYTVSPERIIVGGGVADLPWFHERIRERLDALLGDYPDEPDLDLLVSKPGLGSLSGLAGGLALAQNA
ncbi:MAG: ROK family protein [Acidimicrobiia bacterium]